MKKNCYIKMNYNVYLQLVWLRIVIYGADINAVIYEGLYV